MYIVLQVYLVLFSTFVLLITCSSVFAVNFVEDDVSFPLCAVEQQVMFASERGPRTLDYTDDIFIRYPGLKVGKMWNEEHDIMLLCAVLK